MIGCDSAINLKIPEEEWDRRPYSKHRSPELESGTTDSPPLYTPSVCLFTCMRPLLVAHRRLLVSSPFSVSRYNPRFRFPITTRTRQMATESPAVLASRAVLSSIDLSKYDSEQARLMDERCILVDEQDNALGAADKKTCA